MGALENRHQEYEYERGRQACLDDIARGNIVVISREEYANAECGWCAGYASACWENDLVAY